MDPVGMAWDLVVIITEVMVDFTTDITAVFIITDHMEDQDQHEASIICSLVTDVDAVASFGFSLLELA